MSFPRPKRYFSRHTVIVALLAVFALCVTIWLVFQHKPAWYEPAVPDELTLQAARTGSAAFADDTSDAMVRGQPFEVVLLEKSVNQWLAALPVLWPEVRDHFPPGLEAPAVSFADGEIRVGGLYSHGPWKVIANVGIVPELIDHGESIRLRAVEARGGSLPLPRRLLERLVNRIRTNSRGDQRATGGEQTAGALILREVRTVDDLFCGIRIRNDFVWPNGERRYRIASITITRGELRLGLDPL